MLFTVLNLSLALLVLAMGLSEAETFPSNSSRHHHLHNSSHRSQKYRNDFNDNFAKPSLTKQFRNAGLAAGTDKTGWHNYEYIYGKYLAKDFLPIHNRPIRVLEIGLGCNMGYGPGKSVQLWKSWFSSLELHEMEYDGACVEKWKTELLKLTNVTVHVGDQSKEEDVRKVITSTGIQAGKKPFLPGVNQFDVIIDDGGHYFNQIKTSFDILFVEALRPGGLYVIEDIAPMRIPYPGREYNDGQMITWLQGMLATMIGNAGLEPMSQFNKDPMNMHAYQSRWVASLEIQKNIAAIVKATDDECGRKQAYCPDY
jgi:hypothetical protein